MVNIPTIERQHCRSDFPVMKRKRQLQYRPYCSRCALTRRRRGDDYIGPRHQDLSSLAFLIDRNGVVLDAQTEVIGKDHPTGSPQRKIVVEPHWTILDEQR